MTTTPAKRIKLTKCDGGYLYTGTALIAHIWQFDSAYGDRQWGCDIDFIDGRTRTSSYAQSDTLAGIRGTLANLDEVAR